MSTSEFEQHGNLLFIRLEVFLVKLIRNETQRRLTFELVKWLRFLSAYIFEDNVFWFHAPFYEVDAALSTLKLITFQ